MQVFVLAKSPHLAKTRLAPVLDRDERAHLARAMLADTLITLDNATCVASVTLVSGDTDLARLAANHNALFLHQAADSGMNGAASQALLTARRGSGPVLILHADLPLLRLRDLDDLAANWRTGTVVAAPSIDGGTNALLLDADKDWSFTYGTSSFEAHRTTALSLGRRFRAITRTSLACDLDDPAMLTRMRKLAYRNQCGLNTQAALSQSTPSVPVRSYA